MKSEIRNHLIEQILPFWNALADRENGGFFGYVGHDGQVDPTYPKGIVLHLRILWFYGQCSLALKDSTCLAFAKHAYDFIVKHFLDPKFGGLYWLVSAKGTPVDTQKHGYSHAFFIYAMSAYYEASGDPEALRLAMQIFDTIGRKAPGCEEFCDREWNVTNPTKTTGAILHLVEAYTELYRVCEAEDKFAVSRRLMCLLRIAHEQIYDGSGRLPEVFDADMNPVGEVHSYGHFVEAAWLMNRTVDIIEPILPVEFADNIRQMNRRLVEKADELAFADDGSMYYEEVAGEVNMTRAWWTQAEGIVGFLDAYNRSGEPRYLARAEGLWAFVKSRVIDPKSGEWFNESDENGVPDAEMPLVNEWKCPYHNGRMAMFVL
jgi:mannobiose 2-epimerase